jgi:hypothetical protein
MLALRAAAPPPLRLLALSPPLAHRRGRRPPRPVLLGAPSRSFPARSFPRHRILWGMVRLAARTTPRWRHPPPHTCWSTGTCQGTRGSRAWASHCVLLVSLLLSFLGMLPRILGFLLLRQLIESISLSITRVSSRSSLSEEPDCLVT